MIRLEGCSKPADAAVRHRGGQLDEALNYHHRIIRNPNIIDGEPVRGTRVTLFSATRR